MNKTIAKMWIDALRSGEYTQGKFVLRNITQDTWCCLGVLCDLYQKNCEKELVLPTVAVVLVNDEETIVDSDNYSAEVLHYDTIYNELHKEVAKWAGIDIGRIGWRQGRISKNGGLFETYDLLAEMNDTRNFDFNMIADLIEQNTEMM
jgi:hypothetical protein